MKTDKERCADHCHKNYPDTDGCGEHTYKAPQLAPNEVPWDAPSDPALLDAWAEVVNRRHRDLKDIPTDKIERRDKVRWILEHPLFYYDVEIPDSSFKPVPNSNYQEMILTPSGKIERLGGGFHENAWFDYVYVNPCMERIEEDDSLNTDFRVWIETGGWYDRTQDKDGYTPKEGWNQYNKWIPSHDTNLDCGGKDMEEALLRLAMLVEYYYNDDGSKKEGLPEQCASIQVDDGTSSGDWKSGCERGPDGFCVRCGYLVKPDTPTRTERRNDFHEMLDGLTAMTKDTK